jgi:hypothetical protein
MSIRERLASEPGEWNHPRRARWGPPLLAGVGGAAGSFLGQSTGVWPGITAGLLAGAGALVGYVGLAALD